MPSVEFSAAAGGESGRAWGSGFVALVGFTLIVLGGVLRPQRSAPGSDGD